jgi:hypothetical protein
LDSAEAIDAQNAVTPSDLSSEIGRKPDRKRVQIPERGKPEKARCLGAAENEKGGDQGGDEPKC